MSSLYGKKLKISVFGQSHSPAIGVTIEGLPVGIKIDTEKLLSFLKRRRPGNSDTSTTRSEEDIPEFLSGLVDGITCGAPLTAIIRNTDARSSDYREFRDIPRPSHADYTAHVKFGGFQDVSGGGHFSGRLTAPLCIAGGICLQVLQELGIAINAHILQIGNVRGTDEEMMCEILKAKEKGDSVGGIIECEAVGLPVGLGDPIFDGIENRIASIIFGIPGVKGIEFGSGFEGAASKGSENNDGFYMDGDTVKTNTNHSGGILGGITNGMPVLFRVAFKPTPSISIEQNSVNLSKSENTTIKINGRHDPCIVPRAVPCVEAAAAIALYDAYLENGIVNKL